MTILPPSHQKRKNERGNVLFYILIAVALIAALSYAVSSSNRGSTGQIDTERARLAATEILEYANIVKNAVAQLRLRGCTDTEISFENPIVSGYGNSNAPSDNTCNVFNIAGGGVQYLEPQSNWLDNTHSAEDNYGEIFFTAATCIPYVGTGENACGANSAQADLIFAALYLKSEICIELNKKVNFGVPDAAPIQDQADAWSNSGAEFTGTYPSTGRSIDSATSFDSARSACFESDTYPTAGFHFYQVLISR